MSSSASLKIIAKPSPVAQVCSFTIEQLHVGRTIHCLAKDPDSLKKNTDYFVQELMKIEGIEELLVNDRIITVSKGTSPRDWRDLGKEIGDKIRELFASGKELFSVTATVVEDEKEKETLYKRIFDIFEHEINPSLARHNGGIELVNVDDKGLVYVRLMGGCQGCAKANETLRNGVEKHLKMRLPEEVKGLVDVTEHDDGQNPYY